MEEREIFKSITDTLTGKLLFRITVPIKWRPEKKIDYLPLKWWEQLIGRKPKPIPNLDILEETHRTFEIWPCVVSNQYRIAGNAALLVEDLFDNHSANIRLIIENQPLVVYIVAAAIQNNHLEPNPELIEFIEKNFDYEDLYTALQASFSNLGMQSFSNSIVLLKGTVRMLKPETSPIDGSELIAFPTPTSDPYVNTSDGQSGM